MSDHLPASFSLASTLAEQGVHHQGGPRFRTTGQRKPRNESHHHEAQDCEPAGTAVLLAALTLLLSARAPFLNTLSRFVSTYVSSEDYFRVLDKSPLSGAAKGLPSCNKATLLHLNWTQGSALTHLFFRFLWKVFTKQFHKLKL